MTEIKFYKEDPEAVLPTKREEDAAYDIYTTEKYVKLAPGETHIFKTGLKAVIPPDVWILIKERSSTGSLGISLRAGVIDSGYRGEWGILISNFTQKTMIFSTEFEKKSEDDHFIRYPLSKALAQAIIMPKLKTSSVEITKEQFDEAPATERGAGGYGSSGK